MFSLLAYFALSSALAGISGYEIDQEAYKDGSRGVYPNQTYSTHPGEFPIFNFNPFPNPAPPENPGYLLVAPRGDGVGNPGALILDWSGGLIWDGSEYGETMSFSVQTYLGNPVLAVWTGEIQGNGWGKGRVLVLDQQYQVIANFTTTLADQGQSLDFHEISFTENDTALVLVYNEVDDLLSGVVQELNVSTGEALFTWDSKDHIPTEDCYIARGDDGSAWDYIHLNSIDKDDQGNYLISSRHCSSLFYVAANGTVLWSLGGKYSNFTGSAFYWQHDARWHGSNTISLFDNAANTWEQTGPAAQGVILQLDFENMTVNQTNYTAPTGETSPSQGSFQKLFNSDGEVNGWLAGWGSEPYITEYATNGTVVWYAQFGTTSQSSYRAFKSDWKGYPTTNPAFNVTMSGEGDEAQVMVNVSWNGATEVGYWLLLADNGEVGRADHKVFEDQITVQQTALDGKAELQVAGYSANGGALGWSDKYVIAENRYESVPADQQNRTEGTATFEPSATTTVNPTRATGIGNSTPVASQPSAQGEGGGEKGAGMVRPEMLMGLVGCLVGLVVLF